MKITKTINTAIVSAASLEVKDGKVVTRAGDIVIHSCNPLSDANIKKAVCRVDPKAVILSVEQHSDKYAVDIEEFVKVAHVEQ